MSRGDRDFLPVSAARFAPSDLDSEESLHTVDDDEDGEASAYEDCVDAELDDSAEFGRREEEVRRRRFVDIGDEDITFRGKADDRRSVRSDASGEQNQRARMSDSEETTPKILDGSRLEGNSSRRFSRIDRNNRSSEYGRAVTWSDDYEGDRGIERRVKNDRGKRGGRI